MLLDFGPNSDGIYKTSMVIFVYLNKSLLYFGNAQMFIYELLSWIEHISSKEIKNCSTFYTNEVQKQIESMYWIVKAISLL